MADATLCDDACKDEMWNEIKDNWPDQELLPPHGRQDLDHLPSPSLARFRRIFLILRRQVATSLHFRLDSTAFTSYLALVVLPAALGNQSLLLFLEASASSHAEWVTDDLLLDRFSPTTIHSQDHQAFILEFSDYSSNFPQLFETLGQLPFVTDEVIDVSVTPHLQRMDDHFILYFLSLWKVAGLPFFQSEMALFVLEGPLQCSSIPECLEEVRNRYGMLLHRRRSSILRRQELLNIQAKKNSDLNTSALSERPIEPAHSSKMQELVDLNQFLFQMLALEKDQYQCVCAAL